jgi:isopentenyl-diphosphate delta-isomerase
MEYTWVDPIDLGRSIRLTPAVFSPWLVLQAQLLPFLGGVAPVAAASQRELAG